IAQISALCAHSPGTVDPVSDFARRAGGGARDQRGDRAQSGEFAQLLAEGDVSGPAVELRRRPRGPGAGEGSQAPLGPQFARHAYSRRLQLGNAIAAHLGGNAMPDLLTWRKTS